MRHAAAFAVLMAVQSMAFAQTTWYVPDDHPTINGAIYLGMDDDLGSIETGKLADIVVMDKNPLEQIENSDSVSLTVINGVVYDANTMNQLWPQEIERGKFYFQN